MLVEDGAALGVDVEEIEGGCGGAGTFGEARLDAAEKALEDRSFEGVEEEGEGGDAGKVEGEGVLLVEVNRGEWRSGGVGAVGFEPEG